MAMQVEVDVLRNVPVSDDGITSRALIKGTRDTVPADLYEGLRAEGYVRKPDDQAAPAGDTGPVEIPADWRDQHHATKKKLARLISGADPVDLAAAEAVIEAEVARRAAGE
jgi:hypothetical protein